MAALAAHAGRHITDHRLRGREREREVVQRRVSRLFSSPEMDAYEVVGLSGTSGGAVCALLSWSALVDGAPDQVGP